MGVQRVTGSGNVQIQEVESSWIQVIVDSGPPKILPLEPAELSVSAADPSPARLVNARGGVLGYCGRAELLADLEAWVDSTDPYGVFLIAGPGGSGKTRLAVELCRRLRERDWVCGFLSEDGEGRLDNLIAAPTARLVVIDYAENRGAQLAQLLPQLSGSAQSDTPVRVLMLVRTGAKAQAGDVSKRVAAKGQAVEKAIEGCDVRVLDHEEERLSPDERAQLFESAVESFTAYTDSTAPVTKAPDFSQKVFENPLMVVIAAYLAAQGERAPGSRSELLDGVLWHERLYWSKSAEKLDADDVVLERTIALATLLRADGEAEAAQYLRLHPDLSESSQERRNRFARWARDQYPGAHWWNPLEPDLLGEHLIATGLGDQPACLRGALASETPDDITRPLEVLARAALDHPYLAATLRPILSEELERLCQVAIAQAENTRDQSLLLGRAVTVAAALEQLISAVRPEARALKAAANLMPPRSDLVLSSIMVTLSRQWVEFLRSKVEENSEAYQPELAVGLSNFSTRVAAAGGNDEALEAIEEAVEIFRRLHEEDPDLHVRKLAEALHNLSTRLADAGRNPEALVPIEEAVAFSRELVAEGKLPEATLAAILSGLAHRLAVVDRGAESVAAIEEAVAILRPLHAKDPAAYAADLGMDLNNLSSSLAFTDRRSEALLAIEESVELCRQAAEANPSAYIPRLAQGLNNLSHRLAENDRRSDALAPIAESVALARRLAEVNPGAYAQELALALRSLSLHLSHSDRHAEALAAIEECLATYEMLAKGDPTAYAPQRLRVIADYAERLAAVGLDEQADAVRNALNEILEDAA